MRNHLLASASLLAVFLSSTGAFGNDKEGGIRSVTPVPRSVWIKLPPDAVVTDEDPEQKAWRQSGYLDKSYSGSKRSFSNSLLRQGWALDKVISLSRRPVRTLYLWEQSGRTLYLMLWKQETGRCGFSLAEESGDT